MTAPVLAFTNPKPTPAKPCRVSPLMKKIGRLEVKNPAAATVIERLIDDALRDWK